MFPSGLKEIGFSCLTLTEAGSSSPLAHLDGVHVLHWHGDTYNLPLGALNLASTPIVEQQAFSIGKNILGLQFHPEVETGEKFERWLVGHSAELAAAGIDPVALRSGASDHGERLRQAAGHMLRDWISELEHVRHW